MKKLLILSFEPISSKLSNGRTLKNVLQHFSSDEIYNIYIHGEPDLGFASYYCISDKQALKSMLLLKPKYFIPKDNGESTVYSDTSAFRRRSNFKLFIREIAWSNSRMKKLLLSIANDIKPDAIMVFLGNGGFIMNNAVYLSKTLNVPLISFNCEDYYFKDYDYIKYSNKIGCLHRLYKKKFVKAFDYLMQNIDASIYLTKDLKELYDSRFNTKYSYVIHNSSLLVNDTIICNYNTNSKSFVYAGNISLGRFEELEKIGNIIKEIDPEFSLDVYTSEDRKEFLEKIKNSRHVSYKGSLDYGQLLPILKESFAILHVESLEPFFSKHTIHGFSTKIPDSLASGNCFIAMAAKESSVYKYLDENKCAYCASNIDEIKSLLEKVMTDNSLRIKFIDKAIEIAKANHSLDKNSSVFRKIVDTAIKNYKTAQ